jgi:hypothetical protein
MITTVIGKATPTAPPIIKANADNKFASACTSYPDMPLLHGSPAPEAARWMRTVKKRLTDGIGVYGVVIRVARYRTNMASGAGGLHAHGKKDHGDQDREPDKR